MPCRYVEAGMVAVACAVIVPFVAFAPCRGRPPPPAVGRLSSWYQQNAAWRAFSRKGNRRKSFYRIFLTKYNQHGKVRSSDTEVLLVSLVREQAASPAACSRFRESARQSALPPRRSRSPLRPCSRMSSRFPRSSNPPALYSSQPRLRFRPHGTQPPPIPHLSQLSRPTPRPFLSEPSSNPSAAFRANGCACSDFDRWTSFPPAYIT